jgi:hypothetical protein
MRNGGRVLDLVDLKTSRLKGTNRRLTPWAGPLHNDVYFLDARVLSALGNLLSGYLRGERR